MHVDLLLQGQSVPKHPDKRWKIFIREVCVTAEKNGDVTDSYVEGAVEETVASGNVPAREFEEGIYFLLDLSVKYVVTVYCSRASLKLKVSSSLLFF